MGDYLLDLDQFFLWNKLSQLTSYMLLPLASLGFVLLISTFLPRQAVFYTHTTPKPISELIMPVYAYWTFRLAAPSLILLAIILQIIQS